MGASDQAEEGMAELEGPLVRDEEDLDPAELADLEERRRPPPGVLSRRASLRSATLAALAMPFLALGAGGGGARPDVVPTLYDREPPPRIDPPAAPRPGRADSDKKRRRRAARAARRKNR